MNIGIDYCNERNKKVIYYGYMLIVVDFFSFLLSLGLLWGIFNLFHWDMKLHIPIDEINTRVTIHFFIIFCGIIWFWIRLRHYTYRKPFWFELKEIVRTLAILAVFELAIIAFSKLYFSRYIWGVLWGVTIIIVPLNRILMKKWLIKSKRILKRTIIIGGGENAIDAYNALQSEPYLGLDVKCFLSSHPKKELDKLNIPVLMDIKGEIWSLISSPYDQFIIALEDNENVERDYWLRYLSKYNYRSVSVIPSLRGLPLYGTDMSFLFSYDMIFLRINNNLAKRSSKLIKRLTDVFLSIIALVILFPVILLICSKIRKDGGNVIYGHKRIGYKGKEFNCLKFRTMVNNSDKVLEDLLKTDENAKKEWERYFKLKNDPRITPIGKFLRKTSLDELPQLWNVLKGEMSLVGPRPVVIDELKRYNDDVEYYLIAKPGMTGLWQVSGRNNIDYEKRVYLDSWYVKNWSLWNDFVILCKTVNQVIKRTGAY